MHRELKAVCHVQRFAPSLDASLVICRDVKSEAVDGIELQANIHMDAAIRELVGICLLACACVALAWLHEADHFVLFFGLAAAIAGAEALRRSR
jgi:hypothetical protein